MAVRPRLFLHAGTTKTGTTTLQYASHAARALLLARGVLYPDVDVQTVGAPKHQWLINLPLTGELERFDRNVHEVLAQAEATGASRILMSTEGLSNHWFDLPEAGRVALASLARTFDVVPWVVVREPVAWAVSMYVQALKNQPVALAPVYATAEPIERAIAQPYFATRLRYDLLVQDLERAFGAGSVRVTRYESADILEQAHRMLGLDPQALPSTGDRNKALSQLGVDLLLRVNRMRIAGEERRAAVKAIIDLDRDLGRACEAMPVPDEVRARVLAMSEESERFLEARYGIGWSDVRNGSAARSRAR